MSSDVEFNFKHNGIIDGLKDEEHQVISNKQEQRRRTARKKASPAFSLQNIFGKSFF